VAKNKNKKKSPIAADSQQAQSLFEQYHEIAQALRSSSDQQQAEVALESVSNEPETVQMALLKMLARTDDVDAANVLLALNTLSPLKEVRKEARRGLIRLEQSKTYPSWQPPIENTPAFLNTLEDESGNPPRFWKGYVTDSRGAGEVSMMLLWEQGEGYRDVRGIGFLLEFWSEGVKDFFTYVASKRKAQKEIDENLQSGQYVPCSLAKAKRLLQEALAVHEKLHSKPYLDYRLHNALVNRLILEAEEIGEEEPEEIDKDYEDEDYEDVEFDLTQLTPTDVIINFVEAWVDEDFDLAYDLLASDSPLREGLSQEEWFARREKWFEEALPDRLTPGFVREHESPASGLWLPNALKRRPSNTLEMEAGWSVELKEGAIVESLPELAPPIQMYPETGRRWFWITYGMVHEGDRWRIQSITDEGASLRALPTAQLKKRLNAIDNEANKIIKKSEPGAADNPLHAITELSSVLSLLNSSLFTHDILLTRPETGEDAIKLAYETALALGDQERGIIYLDLLMQRFPEQRAEALRLKAAAYMQMISRYSYQDVEGDEDEDEIDYERTARLAELAEADLRESLNIKNTLEGHLMLGTFLYDSLKAERYDEAEAHLHEAEAMGADGEKAAIIQITLGDIAYQRKQYDQALVYYQRVAETDPQREDIWHKIGDTYVGLQQLDEAENNFKKELEFYPANFPVYSHLVKLYSEAERFDEARELLEHGLIENSDSPHLLALLSSVYFETGEIEQAEEILQEAEEIDPDSPTVQAMRNVLEMHQQKQTEQ
jgi:tetratricopeptide (TPR) repeat protein